MKNKKRIISAILALVLLVAASGTVIAADGKVTKDLYYNNIKITLDGSVVATRDANGKSVDPFNMEGSIYLPVRAVATALGVDVEWDNSTKTVMLRSADSELSAGELFNRCKASVVHIDTGMGGGTGFFIEEDVVVTNNHVISGAFTATAKTVDGQIFDVTEIIARSENPDLALLRVDGKGTPVTLAADAAIGDTIYTIGAPLGIFPTLTNGMVTNNSYSENGVDFYLGNIGAISGNSGGPVFNAYGEVIGVVQGGMSDGMNSLDMIICARHIGEMDRSNPEDFGGGETPDEENYTKTSLADAEIGQLVAFGRYEQDGDEADSNEDILWIVTDKNGSTLSLMSLYCLDVVPFMTEGSVASWEDSYAREFLNGEFFDKAFSAAEKAKILPVNVSNKANPIHGTANGSDTVDKVYLPDLDEIMEYYGIEGYEERFYDGVYAQATPYAMGKDVWLEIPGSSRCWWWLRSTGGNDRNAAEVGSAGYLSFNGSDAFESQRGLRPVIEINIG